MHCHPQKTTSLTALKGDGSIKFLNNTIDFKSGNSFMIRNGLFHQITNKGEQVLSVLEFENPPDSKDLVRLEDKYGREFLGYELEDDLKLIDKNESDFFECLESHKVWSNGETVVETIYPYQEQFNILETSVYAMVSGRLYDVNTNQKILRPGDCITGTTLIRLLERFKWDEFTRLLVIKKVINDTI